MTRRAARNAIMRNKVVVGLSKGVVVMASGPKRDAKLIELFHQSKPKPAARPTQLSLFDRGFFHLL